MSLESRIDALEQQAGAGQPELVIIDVVEVDVDGSEEVRKTLAFYVDPRTKRGLREVQPDEVPPVIVYEPNILPKEPAERTAWFRARCPVGGGTVVFVPAMVPGSTLNNS